MLVARDKSGSLVTSLDSLSKSDVYYCPTCQGQVWLRCGKVIRPYFAHRQLQSCPSAWENESEEHLNLKASLYQALSEQDVAVEYYLANIEQTADILVNQTLALEVQCSRLSEQRLRERTASYHSAGYQVRWFLGEKLWLGQHLTSLHKQFLYFSKNIGFHLWELDNAKQELRLKYLIYEDIKGKVHYLERSCPLGAGLWQFLRYPYMKQPLQSYQVDQEKDLHQYIQKQLYYGNRYWLQRQEEAYLQGENLLTAPLIDFFPQVRPPVSQAGFCQIQTDLTSFYEDFDSFYQKQADKESQILYPPAYYNKMRI